MDHYFFHHFRVGDFEVPQELFDSLLLMIEQPDNKGHRRFTLTYKKDDSEPNVTYVYAWSRNSDFLYLGYIECNSFVDLPF